MNTSRNQSKQTKVRQLNDSKGIALQVLAMSSYEAPVISEDYAGEKKYVTYGTDNSFFTYLTQCYRGSSTNRAAINSIAQMIYGKGLDFMDSEQKQQVLQEINKLFKPKDLRLIAMDFKKYGQCCFQVGWDRQAQKPIKTKHHPVHTIAKGKMDDMGNIDTYWYSANWKDTNNYPPKPIPAFGTSEEKIELMYIGNPMYAGDLMYYDEVDYSSGLQYSKVEEEVSNFHLNNILNGFAPGVLLTFKDGKPSITEQTEIENKVKQKWGGSSKAGSIMIAYVETGEEAPELTTVQQSDLDKQYQFVTDLAESKILVSHRITSPLLLGIKDATGLGGSNADELKTSYQLFNTLVIHPFQEVLIDGISEVLSEAGIVEDLFFVPLYPIEFTDEQATEEEIKKETGIGANTETQNTSEDGEQ